MKRRTNRNRKHYKGGKRSTNGRVRSEGDHRSYDDDEDEILRSQRNAARLKRRLFQKNLRELQEPQEPQELQPQEPQEPQELVASAPPWDDDDIDPHNPAGIYEPSPTSFQVIGYNKHPMFHMNVDEATLMADSEKNGKLQGEDYAVVRAHGAIGNELLPNIKILANKYLRIVEFEKAGQTVGIHPSINVEINKIMRDPDNYAMFDNTTQGAERRAEVFRKLCPYTISFTNGLTLVDITHERIFSGHVDDAMIPDNHTITHNTIGSMLSLGVFVPVDYTKDMSTPFLADKRLFVRYPGTSFLSKQTNMHLVKTMLPIAIRENRRINLLVMSCAVIQTQDDDVSYNLPELKPDTKNPAIEMLTLSKWYMATLNKLLNELMLAFLGSEDMSLLRNTSPYEILLIAQRVNAFYEIHFHAFANSFNTNIGRVEEAFSFSVPRSRVISNELLNEDNAAKIQTSWFGKYLDELIKVKIYLIREFKDLFAAHVETMKHFLDDSIPAVEKLMARESVALNPQTHSLLNAAVQNMTEIQQYIDRVVGLLNYMKTKSYKQYKKYKDVLRVYKETRVHELYDQLTEDMDYDRYVRDETTGRIRKQQNLPPGAFRKTARYIHKFRKLPNFDEAFARARKTRRKKQDNRTTLSV